MVWLLSFSTASSSATCSHVLHWSWESVPQPVLVLITATTLNEWMHACVRACVCLLQWVVWREDKIIKAKECNSIHFIKIYRAPQPQNWKNRSHCLRMLSSSRINTWINKIIFWQFTEIYSIKIPFLSSLKTWKSRKMLWLFHNKN